MGTLTKADLSKHFAWDGDRLVTHDEKVVEELRRTALSPSTAKSMKSCVARWAAEKVLSKWTTEDPFDPAPLGTSGHAIFEEMYGYDPEGRSPDIFRELVMRESLAHKAFQVPENATNELKVLIRTNQDRWRKEVWRVSNGLFKLENPSEVIIHGLETHIIGIDIEGVPINGFIDRIAKINGLLSPEDYKTGKKPAKSMLSKFGDDHGDQLRIYAASIAKMYGEEPRMARILYTEEKAAEAREVNLRPAAMKKTIASFVKGWEIHNTVMEEGVFPTETGPLCGWCPLVNSCPAAAEADYVDAHISKPAKKTTAAPTKVALGIPTIRPMGQIAVISPLEEAVNRTLEAPLIEGEVIETEFRSIEMSKTNEYQLMGVAGLQDAAFSAWRRAGVDKPDLDQLKNMLRLLRFVTGRTQIDVFGYEDLGSLNHTRLRGFLRTSLEHSDPAPVGGDAEAWSEWSKALYTRTLALTNVALTELDGESPLAEGQPFPWLAFDPAYKEVTAEVADAEVSYEDSVETPEPAPAPEQVTAPVNVPDDSDLDFNDAPAFGADDFA